SGAVLDGATATGAKIHGMVPTGRAATDIKAQFLDNTPDGSGGTAVPEAEAPDWLTLGGGPGRRPGGQRRYFGRGDVLRDATLELSDGVRVEIDSLFQNCEVRLRPGTELVVGPSGVL